MGTGVPEGIESGAIESGGRIRLRVMIPADIPAVAELERSTFSTPWKERTFERFLERPSGVEVWVADDPTTGPGPVLGYAVIWIAADQGELANLAVQSEMRRLGVGGRLLDRVLARCQEQGVTALYLEVRSSNEAARALYEGRGFRTVGMRKGYYSKPKEDARVMMCSLPAPAAEEPLT